MAHNNRSGGAHARKKNYTIKVVLGVLIIVIIILLLLRSCGDGRENSTVLEPDYALVDPDTNAQEIPDDPGPVEDKPEVEEGGGSMSLIYSDQVSVDLATGDVKLFYQNPSDSSHSLVLQIIIERDEEQYLVAESGALDPGFMLTELEAEEDLPLAEGIYEGVIKLLFFDSETGERAVVDTNIPVDITVQ